MIVRHAVPAGRVSGHLAVADPPVAERGEQHGQGGEDAGFYPLQWPEPAGRLVGEHGSVVAELGEVLDEAAVRWNLGNAAGCGYWAECKDRAAGHLMAGRVDG